MRKLQRFVSSSLLGGAFFTAACVCWGQQFSEARQASQTAPAVSMQNAYMPSADPSTLLLAAQKVIQLIDQGLASQLWQHVSSVVQGAAEQGEFASHIYTMRAPLGVVLDRRWLTISQIEHQGSDNAPSGTYVTVTFLTSFEARRGMQEQVSFHLDDDGVWRIAGYVLR